MKIEKGIISSTQLMLLIIGLIESETLTSAFISGVTKQSTWIVLIIGFAIILVLLYGYISLSDKFPKKNLIEINDLVYGRYFGKVVSILYVFYFWFIVSTNFRLIADFFSTYLFTEIDNKVFIIVMAALVMYTVKRGLEVIVRSGSIIIILAIIINIIVIILVIKDIDLSNLLPIFKINLKQLVQGVNLMISIPFGEIIVFLMIFPYVNTRSQVKKSAFSGLIIGSIIFLIVILRNIAVLGNLYTVQVLPIYQVAKLINIGQVITRMEILIAVIYLFNVFLKLCIFLYAAVLSMAQLLNLKSYKPLVIPMGIINIVLAIIMFSSDTDEVYQAINIYSVYAILYVIILPVISIVIASIKKKN
ncbi:endospore germination permease [Clostridium neuense]|uniref:Endospore germination permease n=1 Tax=Clostridium neuense TaxID=1728934 RepID=A0ABW8TJI2_9CLOT